MTCQDVRREVSTPREIAQSCADEAGANVRTFFDLLVGPGHLTCHGV